MGSSQRAHPVYCAGGYLFRTTDPGPAGVKLSHIPLSDEPSSTTTTITTKINSPTLYLNESCGL